MGSRVRLSLAVFGLSLGAIALGFFVSLDHQGRLHLDALYLCGFMVVEALIWAWALLGTRPQRLWQRSLLALIVLMPGAAFFTTKVGMHGPASGFFHLAWLAFVILILVITMLVSGTIHAVSLARQRRTAS